MAHSRPDTEDVIEIFDSTLQIGRSINLFSQLSFELVLDTRNFLLFDLRNAPKELSLAGVHFAAEIRNLRIAIEARWLHQVRFWWDRYDNALGARELQPMIEALPLLNVFFLRRHVDAVQPNLLVMALLNGKGHHPSKARGEEIAAKFLNQIHHRKGQSMREI